MIKQMNNEDIDAVMEIWLKTNISAHDFIPEKYWVGNFHAVKGQYLPKSDNYVYSDNGKILAFISVIDEESFIGALFVSDECQGKGIGRKLIDHCKNIYSELEVAVYADNKQAVGFYEKCGFKTVSQQKNSDSGHSEYIMQWVR